MSQFIVEGSLGEDTPVLFTVEIGAYANFDQAMANPIMSYRDSYEVLSVLDTGSRQCLMIPGLFSNRHFGSDPLLIGMADASGNAWECRGQMFFITFESNNRKKTIEVPIYERRFGSYPAGTLLIGRTILAQAVFQYDGPNRKVSLAFADDSDVKL